MWEGVAIPGAAMAAAPAEKSARPSLDVQPYDLQVAVRVVYGIQ